MKTSLASEFGTLCSLLTIQYYVMLLSFGIVRGSSVALHCVLACWHRLSGDVGGSEHSHGSRQLHCCHRVVEPGGQQRLAIRVDGLQPELWPLLPGRSGYLTSSLSLSLSLSVSLCLSVSLSPSPSVCLFLFACLKNDPLPPTSMFTSLCDRDPLPPPFLRLCDTTFVPVYVSVSETVPPPTPLLPQFLCLCLRPKMSVNRTVSPFISVSMPPSSPLSIYL